ncbi:hypothetical protein BN946_scf185043.g109 [Trametes cinnabarina]|uniref:Uncharacterized protein n=1 Tax=Pycnoporus cinnabarinus TaxID=5643 RepID=A0A060SP99_PYCCI|nr:hypothetical protein BN946_scf185043.g109 [Trametes cinnabarina]
MPATPKSPSGSPEPAPAESESSFDAPPSLTIDTQRARSPKSREPAVSQDHSQFSCGDMWSNIPQAEVTDVNVPLASSARAVPDTPSHLSDATQEADSKRVSWGRWGALTRPPKFRSGTLMLSLPRRPQLGRRADARPISVPTDTEPSAASIQACVRTTSPADPVGLTSVEEQGPRTTRPKELSQTLQLRKDPYDKPRRLFVHRDMGILNVSMRGCIDLIEGVNLRSVLEIRAGAMSNVNRQLVDDACVISDGENAIIALGHARSTQQLSLVQLQGKRARDIGTFDRPAQTERNGGISAVCAMMQPDMFATGGYDHFVHLWSISAGRPPTPSAPLALKHTSVVQSLLAIRDTSRKLITASADCSVNIFDLASERVVNTLRLSNSVYHVHPTVSQFCILLERAAIRDA